MSLYFLKCLIWLKMPVLRYTQFAPWLVSSPTINRLIPALRHSYHTSSYGSKGLGA